MTLLQPFRIYVDLDFNFMAHPQTGDLVKVIDVNSVKQSIKLLVLTMFGERLFQPDVGSPVFGMLFEPIDDITTELIRQSIMQTIDNYEPRVILNDVIVTPNSDQNSYAITVYFNIVNIPLPVTFSFTLSRLR